MWRRCVPPRTRLELHEAVPVLYEAVCNWLRKRGKVVRPRLEERQRAELKECFALMDLDSSGAIDVEELSEALKLLGIKMTHRQVQALMDEADKDGTGELEYGEFLQTMTETLEQLATASQGGDEEEVRLPFALMSCAYRRKRYLETVLSGNAASLAGLVAPASAGNLPWQQVAEGGAISPESSGRRSPPRKWASANANTPNMAAVFRQLASMPLEETLLEGLTPRAREGVAAAAALRVAASGQPVGAASSRSGPGCLVGTAALAGLRPTSQPQSNAGPSTSVELVTPCKSTALLHPGVLYSRSRPGSSRRLALGPEASSTTAQLNTSVADELRWNNEDGVRRDVAAVSGVSAWSTRAMTGADLERSDTRGIDSEGGSYRRDDLDGNSKPHDDVSNNNAGHGTEKESQTRHSVQLETGLRDQSSLDTASCAQPGSQWPAGQHSKAGLQPVGSRVEALPVPEVDVKRAGECEAMHQQAQETASQADQVPPTRPYIPRLILPLPLSLSPPIAAQQTQPPNPDTLPPAQEGHFGQTKPYSPFAQQLDSLSHSHHTRPRSGSQTDRIWTHARPIPPSATLSARGPRLVAAAPPPTPRSARLGHQRPPSFAPDPRTIVTILDDMTSPRCPPTATTARGQIRGASPARSPAALAGGPAATGRALLAAGVAAALAQRSLPLTSTLHTGLTRAQLLQSPAPSSTAANSGEPWPQRSPRPKTSPRPFRPDTGREPHRLPSASSAPTRFSQSNPSPSPRSRPCSPSRHLPHSFVQGSSRTRLVAQPGIWQPVVPRSSTPLSNALRLSISCTPSRTGSMSGAGVWPQLSLLAQAWANQPLHRSTSGSIQGQRSGAGGQGQGDSACLEAGSPTPVTMPQVPKRGTASFFDRPRSGCGSLRGTSTPFSAGAQLEKEGGAEGVGKDDAGVKEGDWRPASAPSRHAYSLLLRQAVGARVASNANVTAPSAPTEPAPGSSPNPPSPIPETPLTPPTLHMQPAMDVLGSSSISCEETAPRPHTGSGSISDVCSEGAALQAAPAAVARGCKPGPPSVPQLRLALADKTLLTEQGGQSNARSDSAHRVEGVGAGPVTLRPGHTDTPEALAAAGEEGRDGEREEVEPRPATACQQALRGSWLQPELVVTIAQIIAADKVQQEAPIIAALQHGDAHVADSVGVVGSAHATPGPLPRFRPSARGGVRMLGVPPTMGLTSQAHC